MSVTGQASIAERLLGCFPSGSYALTALLRLMDIVETSEVATAAVECRVQPRLLINPEFVERHAATPEKLLMLVMHELHHVLLGHTTLFPAITPVQNFVFDCVINGLISRMFRGAEHTSFLTEFYSDTKFPECLLRPAADWPAAKDAVPPGIAALAEPRRKRAAAVHRALYSSGGATYHEVYRILPAIVRNAEFGEIPLLGGHDPEGATDGRLDRRSPLMLDVVRGIVEKWPQPPDPICGRSVADILGEASVRVVRRPSNRALLRGLIRKVAGSSSRGTVRRVSAALVAAATPVPTLDRRTAVLRSIGFEPLLHSGTVTMYRLGRSGERVHIYIDVSGSMEGVMEAVYGAVLDCEYDVWPKVHLFSTTVADISLAEVRRGRCRSTGGTDIRCVAEHAAANRVRRAVLITDGWVGRPEGGHLATLKGMRLAVAYAGDCAQRRDLGDVTDFHAELAA